MDKIQEFREECASRIEGYANDKAFQGISRQWLEESMRKGYPYNFSWMGRPIIQNPVDMVAMQEIIWETQPDLIIETGIAHGGSLIYYASLLELNAISGGPQLARVLGIDIDIREHNRGEIESHPMFRRIALFQGSSTEETTIDYVRDFTKKFNKILLILDSNHTHRHVLDELEAYTPLVSLGSYCVVFDTHVEYFTYAHRPWGKGNNPMTAVDAFLANHPEFEIDEMMDAKLMISVAPRGYLRRK
ncbi:MAG: cephalosporin hydroxylase family protein [Desulfovibrio sp.]|jgi:cephalosporin hydroxylase|nr:cephalosporin hydroxylase family protein [Desulfovibrio sp.]